MSLPPTPPPTPGSPLEGAFASTSATSQETCQSSGSALPPYPGLETTLVATTATPSTMESTGSTDAAPPRVMVRTPLLKTADRKALTRRARELCDQQLPKMVEQLVMSEASPEEGGWLSNDEKGKSVNKRVVANWDMVRTMLTAPAPQLEQLDARVRTSFKRSAILQLLLLDSAVPGISKAERAKIIADEIMRLEPGEFVWLPGCEQRHAFDLVFGRSDSGDTYVAKSESGNIASYATSPTPDPTKLRAWLEEHLGAAPTKAMIANHASDTPPGFTIEKPPVLPKTEPYLNDLRLGACWIMARNAVLLWKLGTSGRDALREATLARLLDVAKHAPGVNQRAIAGKVLAHVQSRARAYFSGSSLPSEADLRTKDALGMPLYLAPWLQSDLLPTSDVAALKQGLLALVAPESLQHAILAGDTAQLEARLSESGAEGSTDLPELCMRPLFLALATCDAKALEVLLEHASPSAKAALGSELEAAKPYLSQRSLDELGALEGQLAKHAPETLQVELLCAAIATGDENRVAQLLARSETAKVLHLSRASDLMTPMMLGCTSRSPDIRQRFLAPLREQLGRGDTTALATRSADGHTLLHLLARSGAGDMAEQVLGACTAEALRAALSVQDSRGMTPVAHAWRYGQLPIVRTALQLDRGSLHDTKSAPAVPPPFILTCLEPTAEAAAARQLALRELLKETGATLKGVLDTRDAQTGATALHYAASKGNASAVAQLVVLGADPNARDLADKTPLERAADPRRPWLEELLTLPDGKAVPTCDRPEGVAAGIQAALQSGYRDAPYSPQLARYVLATVALEGDALTRVGEAAQLEKPGSAALSEEAVQLLRNGRLPASLLAAWIQAGTDSEARAASVAAACQELYLDERMPLLWSVLQQCRQERPMAPLLACLLDELARFFNNPHADPEFLASVLPGDLQALSSLVSSHGALAPQILSHLPVRDPRALTGEGRDALRGLIEACARSTEGTPHAATVAELAVPLLGELQGS